MKLTVRLILLITICLLTLFVVLFNVFDHTFKSDLMQEQLFADDPSSKSSVENQTWQKIDWRGDMFVFSAYLDRSGNESKIRCIGARTRDSSDSDLLCRMWYETNTVITIGASLEYFPHSSNLRYSAVYFFCPLHDSKIPHSVSIFTSQSNGTLNLLPVTAQPLKSTIKRNFTVCVCPFNLRYDQAYALVEWIELNRMLGANYFVFYNYSTSWNVREVLKFYSKRRLAEVVQWPLPMGVHTVPKRGPEEIQYFGQTVALNDCLYRSKMTTKYLVNIDLDEFIIPREPKFFTWEQLIAKLPEVSVYHFRNTFFRKEWPDTLRDYKLKGIAKAFRLVTLLKLQREDVIFPVHQRSKYIINPRQVTTLAVHEIWDMADEKSQHTVSTVKGLLHHYRNCTDWVEPDGKTPKRNDDTMLKYNTELIQNVQFVWSFLKNVPMSIHSN